MTFKTYKYITLIISVIFISHINLHSQSIKVYDDFSVFENEILLKKNGKNKVINFFAMFCKPCLEELPHFIELSKRRDDIEFVWVSLDLESKKLTDFVKQKEITDNTVWLKAARQNEWIPKVHNEWEGPIPITLFITNDKRHLSTSVYQSVDELNNEIKLHLN